MSQDVLIVEDDRALSRSLARALQAAGYSVRETHDGESALREVEKAAPDLILLDLLLPKLDGHGVLAALGRERATRDLPVLAMSGIFRGRNYAGQIEREGARGLLEKPFTGRSLLARVRALIGEAQPAAPPGPAAPAAPRVQLTDRPVAEVIWEAVQKRFHGALNFQSGRRHKVLLLERGEPRAIQSNVIRECLGQRLCQAGVIDERVIQDSVRRARAERRLQGEELIEMGLLQRSELERALVAQAEEKLLDLFSWNEGEAWLQPGVSELPAATPLLGWTARAVILRGVDWMDEGRAIAQLVPRAEQRVALEPLELSDGERPPAARAAIEAVEAGGSVGELLESHATALYGLWLVGAIRFGEEAPAVVEGEPTAPAPPEAGEGGVTVADLTRIRNEQASQNLFERLGVDPQVPRAEVRRAFLVRAKRYHPDRFRRSSEEAQTLAAEVFAGISEAHDTLFDPEARRSYAARLRSGTSEAEDRKAVAQIVSAEKECRRGEELLKRRDYTGAAERFRKALELDGDEGEFHAFYGWSLFLSRNEDSEARELAQGHLERAIELAPRSPTGYYYRGLMSKTCEEPDQAEAMFRKVLEVRPGHLEAARELRLLEARRKAKRESSSGGVFGRVRRRK